MHDCIGVIGRYADGQPAVFGGAGRVEPQVFVLKTQGVAKLVAKDACDVHARTAGEDLGIYKYRSVRSRAVGKERDCSVASA